MTWTSPTQFKNFLKLCSLDLLEHIWFFPVRRDRKNPDVPLGSILRGNNSFRLNKFQCNRRLCQGGNIGIYAQTSGLMFVDLDVKNGNILASPGYISKFNETLTVKSRNGGYQLYFQNDGKYANQILKENDISVGELRTDWYYVVSIGSYVTPDENNFDGNGIYRIVSGKTPIAKFAPIGLDLKLKGEPQETKTRKSTENRVEKFIESKRNEKKMKRKITKNEIEIIRGKLK